VWCSHGGVHLLRESKLANETDCQRQALESGKNAKNRILRRLALCPAPAGLMVTCWALPIYHD
jgi:hypothetical protein